MCRAFAVSILLACAAVTVGCAAGGGAAAPAWEGWARRQGGMEDAGGAAPTRATLALARLSVAAHSPATTRPTVRVLASERPCAYAWPDGALFVTRGLLDLLDDEELTATLAHEMGHLAVGPAAGCAALADEADPAPAAVDVEANADAAGCDLLRASGLPPAALARALAKVRDAPQTPAGCRPGLSRRIRRLDVAGASYSGRVTSSDAAPNVILIYAEGPPAFLADRGTDGRTFGASHTHAAKDRPVRAGPLPGGMGKTESYPCLTRTDWRRPRVRPRLTHATQAGPSRSDELIRRLYQADTERHRRQIGLTRAARVSGGFYDGGTL